VLFNVGGQSVDALTLERVSGNRLCVLAATATRLYEFQGSGSVAGILEQYEGKQPPGNVWCK
jgi:hypothetical protein